MAARTFPFGMRGDTSEEGTRPSDLMVRMGIPSNAPSWSVSPRDGAGRQPGHQLNEAGVPPTTPKRSLTSPARAKSCQGGRGSGRVRPVGCSLTAGSCVPASTELGDPAAGRGEPWRGGDGWQSREWGA